MSLKVAEVGKDVYLYTGYNMSAKTALEAYTYSPSSASATLLDARLSLVNATYSDPTLGSLAPNTYAKFTTQAGDFTAAGSWQIYMKYTDATKTLYSDTGTLTVTAVGFS